MKVLISGSTGFIGSHLTALCIEKGHEVTCLVRSSSNLRWIEDLNVKLLYTDLFDKNALRTALADAELVFHLAGVTKAANADAYEKGNYIVTKNFADVLKQSKSLKRFVFIGSQAAYGPSDGLTPIHEEDPARPLTDYGRSKLKAQQFITRECTNLPYTIVIPPAVYGPRDTDVLQFFKTVKKGIIPKVGGNDKYTSIIHVRDLVAGIYLAATHRKSLKESFFLCNERPVRWGFMARVALSHWEKKALTVPIPLPLVRAIAAISEGAASLAGTTTIVNRQKVLEMEPDFWVCSGRKARDIIGFREKVSIRDGIISTLDWYRENGWL